jgi:ribosomal protein L3 glutamine methyltransferase
MAKSAPRKRVSPGRRTPLAEPYLSACRDLLTVRDLARFAVSRFVQAGLVYGHGSDNAWDEAVYLVLHALHVPAEQFEACLDARLLAAEREAALRLVQRRVVERVPAAYLTQEAWIGDVRFHVDERVIVPRSFIGEWLRDDLSAWVPDPDGVVRALDLCTGSGCLAVLLALAFPEAHVDAVDISADALAVARRNVDAHGLQARTTLYAGDLFAPLGRKRYQVIVTNPPYVTEEAMAALPQEYRHEPALALAGGKDGLDIVRRILAGVRPHLEPGGLLVVEAGHARPAVERAFPGLPFTWLETYVGDDAVFLLQRESLA